MIYQIIIIYGLFMVLNKQTKKKKSQSVIQMLSLIVNFVKFDKRELWLLFKIVLPSEIYAEVFMMK